MLIQVRQVADTSRSWFALADRLDWRSFDPFDLLLSPYLKDLQRVSPVGARLAIQVGKQLGLGARKALRIEPHEEAQTLSSYLSAAGLFVQAGQSWAEPYLSLLAQRLAGKAIETPNGLGWGLGFPYVSRFVSVPHTTPNIYQTLNAVQAFLEITNGDRPSPTLDLAAAGCRFVAEGLGRFERFGRTWFRYWPDSKDCIVNVQALAAGLLARAARCLNDPQLNQLANEAAETVLAVQRADGSWPYAVGGRGDFVDGFHTGFVLQGLSCYMAYGPKWRREPIVRAVRQGFRYFKEHLMTTDSRPRGFADGRASQDGQNFAQCVQTFLVCSEGEADLEAAWQLWNLMLDIPQLHRQTAERKFSRGPDFPQLRWTFGPSVLAAACLLETTTKIPRSVNS